MGEFTLTIIGLDKDKIEDKYTNTLKLLIFMLYYAYFKQMYGNPINEHLFDQIDSLEDSPSFNITILKILKGLSDSSHGSKEMISALAKSILDALTQNLDFGEIIDKFKKYLDLYITEEADKIKYEEDKIKFTQNINFEEYNYIILALTSINYYIDTENNYLLSKLRCYSSIEKNYAFEKGLLPDIDKTVTLALTPPPLPHPSSTSTTASASASATASAIFDTDKPYTKANADKLASNVGFMQGFIDALNTKNFDGYLSDFITYLKLAKYIITDPDKKLDDLEDYYDGSEEYLTKARIYAEELESKFKDTDIINEENFNEENFNKRHKAAAIMFVVNGENMKDHEDAEKTMFTSLTTDKIDINTVNKIKIEFKIPSIKIDTEIEAYGYTPKEVDRGGGGDCFYFSVWGCLIDLGKSDYDNITAKLKALGDSMKKGYVNFEDTFTNITVDAYIKAKSVAGNSIHKEYNDCRNNFNINIRKLIALCLLIDTYWYEAISPIPMKTLLDTMTPQYIDVIKQKLKDEGKDPDLPDNTIKLIPFKNNEHNIILSNTALLPTILTDEIKVLVLKVLLSMCDVILDVYGASVAILKLPSKVEDTFYIYVRNIDNMHYREIKTEDGKEKRTFIRTGSYDEYSPNNLWKLQ